MKASLLFLSTAAALALSSCSDTSMQVEATPVAGVNYSAYKTYEWVPLDRNTAEDPTDEEAQIRAAFVDEVDKIMARKGLTKVGQGQSDLIVYARGLRAAGVTTIGKPPEINSKVIYAPYYQPDEASSQWLGGTGYLTESTQTSARFLISEPKTDKVVWRGKAVVTMDDKRSQPLAQHDARLLARKLMKDFPAK